MLIVIFRKQTVAVITRMLPTLMTLMTPLISLIYHADSFAWSFSVNSRGWVFINKLLDCYFCTRRFAKPFGMYSIQRKLTNGQDIWDYFYLSSEFFLSPGLSVFFLLSGLSVFFLSGLSVFFLLSGLAPCWRRSGHSAEQWWHGYCDWVGCFIFFSHPVNSETDEHRLDDFADGRRQGSVE